MKIERFFQTIPHRIKSEQETSCLPEKQTTSFPVELCSKETAQTKLFHRFYAADVAPARGLDLQALQRELRPRHPPPHQGEQDPEAERRGPAVPTPLQKKKRRQHAGSGPLLAEILTESGSSQFLASK